MTAVSGKALVVVSRFNEEVTRELLDGATRVLGAAGYDDGSVDVLWVPGAFELPVAVSRGLGTGRYRFAVALAAVIRGETPHFEYVSTAATNGLVDVSTRTGIPVGFGVLTCDTLEQAMARAGGRSGNKGEEAAQAALATLRALDALDDASA